MRQKIISMTATITLCFAMVLSPVANTINDTSAASEAKTKKVYYVPGSSYAYHSTKRCRTLARSKHIKAISLKSAKAKGLRACKVCH